MTPQKTLDLKGNFRKHPFAELLVEITQAKLTGSLRLSRETQKTIIYFNNGQVVYAVSNARALRLFSILLGQNKIDKQILAKHPDFANDIEFAASLKKKGDFGKTETDAAVTSQIEAIIVDALTWQGGEWLFSPLARPREDLVRPTDIFQILVQYARCMPSQAVSERFKSVREAFLVSPESMDASRLQTHEQFVLSQFNGTALSIEQLRPVCGLPEAALTQALYVLWLGGILIRSDWNSAFSAAKIGEILTAKVSLVKEAVRLGKPAEEPEPAVETDPEPAEAAPKLPELFVTFDEYLDRVEKAQTLYDVLGLESNAPLSDIKNSYFGLAKLFHPDKYHRETPATLRRVQVAFTQLARAYETLKNNDSRESYDYKMRKEIEALEKRRAAGQPEQPVAADLPAEHGLASFEQGLNMLNDEEYAAAATYLARAVHYSAQNALYHAYFGKALSYLEKQHHKAEAELQTAVKLDPKNTKIRIMLVEFFIEMNMGKRAEGELKRFLDIAPGNKEAMALLNGLPK